MSLQDLNLPPANNSVQWTINETALNTAEIVLKAIIRGERTPEELYEIVNEAGNEQFVSHEKLYREGCERNNWTD